MKKLLFILSIFIISTATLFDANAAFPIKSSNTTENTASGSAGSGKTTSGTMSPARKGTAKAKATTAQEKKVRNKSRSTAFLLALLPFITCFTMCGLHNLYLGHEKKGIVQLLLAYLFGGIALSVGAPAAWLVCLFGGLFMFLWHLIDILKIHNGKIQPKRGKYYEDLVK